LDINATYKHEQNIVKRAGRGSINDKLDKKAVEEFDQKQEEDFTILKLEK